MRGWTFTSRGKPAEVLKLRNDLPKPNADTLEPHEVLVKVSHVGICQGFVGIMGLAPHVFNTPWIPDFDFSGIIEAVGSQVMDFKKGDPVFGAPDARAYVTGKYNGVLAEYAVVPGKQIVRKPDSVSFESAAGLACSGCTAVQFAEITRLKSGDKVVVTAASSSLGGLMVQIARSIVGKEGIVIGTCSAANDQLVKNIGADETIDYRTVPNLHEYLAVHHSSEPFDAIIDISGSDDLLYDKSPAYLKPEGTFLSGGKMSFSHGGDSVWALMSHILRFNLKTSWPRILGGIPRRGVFHPTKFNGEGLLQISQLLENGQLEGLVDSTWEMEQAVQAYERVGTSRARGKVVVHVQDV